MPRRKTFRLKLRRKAAPTVAGPTGQKTLNRHRGGASADREPGLLTSGLGDPQQTDETQDQRGTSHRTLPMRTK